MEFYTTLNVIRKRLWLVLLTGLVAALGAAYIDHRQHPYVLYIATARLSLGVPNRYIVPPGSPLGAQLQNSADLTTLAGTYNAYVSTRNFAALTLASRFAKQYHLPATMTAPELAAGTTGALVPTTSLYDISVSARNGQTALNAALAQAAEFVDLDRQVREPTLDKTAETQNRADSAAQVAYQQQAYQLSRQILALQSNPALSGNDRYQRMLRLESEKADVEANIAKVQTALSSNGAPPTAYIINNSLPTVLLRSALVRYITLLAALGGLIVGVGLALLREYLDTSLGSVDAVAEALALPVLATIPAFAGRARSARLLWPARTTSPAAQPDIRASLVTLRTPFAVGSEAFRNLRTGLLFAGAVGEDKVRSVVISSAAAGEGKSTVAANLAIVMAQAGTQVILVDGDMRQPAQHQLFGLDNTTGLSTLYLADAGVAAQAVATTLRTTVVPALRVLTAGPTAPNPAELLASPRTPSIFAALRDQADVIVVDSPAMGLLTDAVVLASHTDGIALVVRAHATRRERVVSAYAKLMAVNARVLGVVLTMATRPGGEVIRDARTAGAARWTTAGPPSGIAG